MARIPQVEDLGNRPRAGVTRQTVDYSGVHAAGVRLGKQVDKMVDIAGDGMAAIGKAITNAGNEIQRKDAEHDRLSLARANSVFNANSLALQQSLENDPDFGTYETRYGERMNQVIGDITKTLSPSAKGRFLASMPEAMTRGRLAVGVKALKMERDVNVANLDGLTTANRETFVASTDPIQRQEAITATSVAIMESANAGYISHEEAEKRAQNAQVDYADALITRQGDPNRKLALLDGKLGEMLPDDHRMKLRQRALAERNALATEARLQAERERKAAERAEKKLQEETANLFVQRRWDPAAPELTPREVIKSPLSAAAKTTILKDLEREARGEGNRTNYPTYNALHEEVALGNISLEDFPTKVLPYIGGTYGITAQDYSRLRDTAEELRGEKENQQLKQFRAMAKAQISGTNLLRQDPVGDQMYYNFSVKLDERIAELREQNVPFRDMLNPENEHYLGKIIQSYTRTPQQQIRDMRDRMGGGNLLVPPPTLP